jgi:hypothetical protein
MFAGLTLQLKVNGAVWRVFSCAIYALQCICNVAARAHNLSAQSSRSRDRTFTCPFFSCAGFLRASNRHVTVKLTCDIKTSSTFEAFLKLCFISTDTMSERTPTTERRVPRMKLGAKADVFSPFKIAHLPTCLLTIELLKVYLVV